MRRLGISTRSLTRRKHATLAVTGNSKRVTTCDGGSDGRGGGTQSGACPFLILPKSCESKLRRSVSKRKTRKCSCTKQHKIFKPESDKKNTVEIHLCHKHLFCVRSATLYNIVSREINPQLNLPPPNTHNSKQQHWHVDDEIFPRGACTRE